MSQEYKFSAYDIIEFLKALVLIKYILNKLSCIKYYALQSNLLIQHSALLDDGTSHAHHLTLTAHAARGSIKTNTFHMSIIHHYRIQIHSITVAQFASFHLLRGSICSI